MDLSLYWKGSKRVTQGFTVRGCRRPNRTATYWPLLLWPSALCLSCSPDAQPEARGLSFLLSASFLYHIFSPTGLLFNRASQGPLLPGGGFLYNFWNCDTMKQSVCGWQFIYIYIYINPLLMYLNVFRYWWTESKNKRYITPVYIINTQHLQSSNIHAKVTSLLQYTHPWLWPKIEQKVPGNQLIMGGLLTNSRQIL